MAAWVVALLGMLPMTEVGGGGSTDGENNDDIVS